MNKYFFILIFNFTFFCLYAQKKSIIFPKEIADSYALLPEVIDYNNHVKPILSDKCFVCHGPDKTKQQAGLRLDFAANAYSELPESPGKRAITPKNLLKSEVFHRIISSDPSYYMPTPKSHLSLSAKEKAIIIKWIQNGAEYQPHWAFVKPIKNSLPVLQKSLAYNPIDNFIFSKLESNNLVPSKSASKELLLRRLSFDLTGLPPTLMEIDFFLQDKDPNSYEKQVDRLLSSSHFGEKMAVFWLDMARFSDSHGYTVDRIRDMSPYRDWVISAFNSNMRYDNFIHQQLAGDLMKNPTKEMLIATSFNRNHAQNMEGGIVEEEFQTEYVMDRTNTLGETFLSMSFGCARCHDHKYDPISQKNYYEMFSFFNNIKEAGQISWNDDMPTPTILLPTKEKEEIVRFINEKIKNQEKLLEKSMINANEKFEKWLNQEKYKSLKDNELSQIGLQGFYSFEDSLRNSFDKIQSGVIKRDGGTKGERPVFEIRETGKSLLFDGDSYLDLKRVGVFRKSDPFTIGMWIYIPKEMKEGVIFHKSDMERLYNFKGYNVQLKGNKLEIMMAHTAPSNAITKITEKEIEKNQWIQLTLRYDGSSSAKGFKLFLDGKEAEMETTMDQLYKDIIFFSKSEPSLQIGGWGRGLGFKGGKVDDIVVYERELTDFEIKILARKGSWEPIISKSFNQINSFEKGVLNAYYLMAVDDSVHLKRLALKLIRTAFSDSTEKIPEIMVMQEMAKPKKSFILRRGQYDLPTTQVFPNTPPSILPFSNDFPKNRLGLAQWLTNKDNPLTARVAVNHFWQNIFGLGIVKTSEDFGNQGEMPSHPELLDWLSINFLESGWDVKKLIKLMVMSATYQQDSKTSEVLKEYDPENRLLARGPSSRLTAEMIRDNALTASGLLNPSIGGKSIRPYQPEGLWEINNTSYKPDSSKDIYKRSLYIITKRTVPNPTLSTFDATSRSYCVVRRQTTNTPLQALVTLNDPTYVETSKVLGEAMAAEPNIKEAISKTFRKLTGIYATEKELDILLELHKAEHNKFIKLPYKAKGWLNSGLYKIKSENNLMLIAANAVVANAIMNTDATLTKR